MSKENEIFQGNVQIYLQGQNALIPVGDIREDQMTYFIGAKNSNLLIKDFRQNPILAAQHVLSGLDGIQFADVFNQSAYAEIFVSNKNDETASVEIKLLPTEEIEDVPTLWLGVVDDFRMPMVDLEWEILRPISLEKVAFAAMAKPNFNETITTESN